MHIKFKNLCNASKHMNMHMSNAIKLVFLLYKNFDPSQFLNVASSLSMSMSNLYFFVSNSPKAFISLYNLSPFVINFHKMCASHWCKGLHWGRWLRLESCIFYGHHLYSSLDTICRSYDLDTNCSGAPPPFSKHGSFSW